MGGIYESEQWKFFLLKGSIGEVYLRDLWKRFMGRVHLRDLR